MNNKFIDKFKYNGQEHDESFGLNVTEMTFRQYDMALGRFKGIDKLASHTFSMTPYHFAGNDPVAYGDPTGLKREAFSTSEESIPYSNLGNDFSSFGPYNMDNHWSAIMGFGGVYGTLSQGGGGSSMSNGGLTAENAISAILGISNGNPDESISWTNSGGGFSSDVGLVTLAGNIAWSITYGEPDAYTTGNLGGSLGGIIYTRNSIRPVNVEIGNVEVGQGIVSGYLHGEGRSNNIYRVPLYNATVSGINDAGQSVSQSFTIVRFGVKEGKNVSPRVVGLSDDQTHTLNWVNYMGGSWQVYDNFLIHDGADDPTTQPWGTLGCVEICGVNGWQNFNSLIMSLSGSNDYGAISNAGLLTVHYLAAPRPPLVRR